MCKPKAPKIPPPPAAPPPPPPEITKPAKLVIEPKAAQRGRSGSPGGVRDSLRIDRSLNIPGA
jgi:hypothetical protein